MKTKLAYVKNLRDQIGVSGVREIAVCPCCGSEYSANKGDYWNLRPNDALTCCDGIICELLTKHTIYKAVV